MNLPSDESLANRVLDYIANFQIGRYEVSDILGTYVIDEDVCDELNDFEWDLIVDRVAPIVINTLKSAVGSRLAQKDAP